MTKEPEGPELPLRQRKKQETRRRISDVASALFLEHGFDNVTVVETAKAADVSTMTVFNYFPRKEDLFLDRIPEAIELFTGAVRDRRDDETPLAALRRVTLELLDQGHPLTAVRERFLPFWRVVGDSPALRARGREALEELETALAATIAETTDGGAHDLRPRLTAALAVAAYRTVATASLARLVAGEPEHTVLEDHRALVHRTFDALERALPEAT
ncbi:TetR/AcrR family transcriptional regulator [Kitasatospora sp. NPDC094011]|uniref:TetR/AcrR family transcriptional regulator n=1 Tax=Kitasatospora sp. NPDC094011 TaxID=3364090 RepID=UPI003814DE58